MAIATIFPVFCALVCAVLYHRIYQRLLYPPDVGSEGKEVVDEEQEDAAGGVLHLAYRRKDDAFGRRWRRRFEQVGDAPAVTERHRGDVLLDAVLVDLEFLFLEVRNEAALIVLHDDVHRDGVDLHSEGWRLCLPVDRPGRRLRGKAGREQQHE